MLGLESWEDSDGGYIGLGKLCSGCCFKLWSFRAPESAGMVGPSIWILDGPCQRHFFPIYRLAFVSAFLVCKSTGCAAFISQTLAVLSPNRLHATVTFMICEAISVSG